MHLLIIGSIGGYITSAGKIAVSKGANVSHVDNIDGGIDYLRSGKHVDLVMVDVVLDVAQLITKLTNEHINTTVIACGIGSDPDLAVKAIKAGAREYLPLPPDPELIAAVLEVVAQDCNTTIFNDIRTKQAFDLARQVAKSDAGILITGESGTGKEVMARFVHQNSMRREMPFICVNCAAIPDNLLESELFGHEKGAFTGAMARRTGKFEQANGGTLLLDEISEMDIRLQAKLLRAIQEREIDRVGGVHPVKINIRLIATSNRKMEQEIKAGNFREDLYFRLNVININMPPLRERPKDIDILAQHFVEKYSKLNAMVVKEIRPEAMLILHKYSWPGNVRELENAMYRAVLLSNDNFISVDNVVKEESYTQISAQSQGSDTGSDDEISNDNAAIQSKENNKAADNMVGQTVAEVEKHLILGTLNHCFGNRTHAANILGISIRTLRNKLKVYEEGGEDVVSNSNYAPAPQTPVVKS